MYEMFFVNFWVIILCPVFVHYYLKNIGYSRNAAILSHHFT